MTSTSKGPATAPTAGGASKEAQARARAERQKDRVSIRRVIPWSTHAFSMNALIVLTGYFTIYATDTLRLNPAIVGGLLVLAKVLDAVGALLSGYLVDRAPETRFGKARPFDLVIVLCWAATAFMFSTPGGLHEVGKYIWVFSSYVLLTAVFMPLYQANSPLFTARVFPRREHYSDVAAKSGLVAVLAAIVITVCIPLAVQAAGKSPSAWALVALAVAVPFGVIGMVRFWVFRESPDAAKIDAEAVRMRDILIVLKTNRYLWLLSALSLIAGVSGSVSAGAYYFRYVVGNIGLQGLAAASYIVLIPLMALFPVLVRRFSVSRIIALTSFIGAAGFLLMTIAGANLPLVMLSLVLQALAAVPLSFLGPILVIDNATYNEWKGLRRLESTGGAMFAFAGTVGQAVAAGITGIVLAVSGYQGSASQQTTSALNGIVAVSSWIPALFALAAGILALYYARLETNIKRISAEVLARREAVLEENPATALPMSGAATPPASGTEAVRVIRRQSRKSAGLFRRRTRDDK